ncbi:MAG: IPT/TIG domain-containing protein [Gemmataceae bacterium]|nr:IPT/TIG domain-containing protein [Gemmataceae bacterium]MCI0738129.1 IPT/TIG domain-containing protein [Gemmataceae bacterium]
MSIVLRAGTRLIRVARQLFVKDRMKTCPAKSSRRYRPFVEQLETREVLSFNGNQLFPDDHPWNQSVASAPVASNSTTLINAIGANKFVHADFGTIWEGAYIGIPITVVSGNQPKVDVIVDEYADESDLIQVPIPANALIEGDPLPSAQNNGDRHVIVYDKDNNDVYELFYAHRPSETADGKWHCDSLAFWDLDANYFRTPGDTSADAAGLTILPGLVRPDEVLDQGVIDHAIRFTVNLSRNQYVFPASHQAGSNNASYPRMGERFRLKASFDISGFSPANQVILRALKEYGMIVADNGSSWYLSGQPSDRWDDSELHELHGVHGYDFEVVDLRPQLVSAVAGGAIVQGTVITLTGKNFSGAAGTTKVFFGNVQASQVQVVSDTQIRATVGTVPSGFPFNVSVSSGYGLSNAVAVQSGWFPPAPTLVAPTGASFNAKPMFSWNAVAGADFYDLMVNDVTAGQAQILRNQNATVTTFTPANPLPAGHSYQWWVKAFNNAGESSPWSAAGSFSVTMLSTPTPANPKGSIAVTNPTFSWSAVNGADAYDLWVDDRSTNQSQVYRNTDIVGTSVAVNLLAGHHYQWWVRAVHASGHQGAWSAGVTFNIAIGTPTPSGPSGSIQTAKPAFSWSAISGATYDLWVNDATTGQAQVIRQAALTSASFTPTTPLSAGHDFQWWVRAYVPSGNQSAWTNVLGFHIVPLATPAPSGPNGSITNAKPTFSWSAVTGADKYDVWVNDLTTGQAQVLRKQDATGTSWTPTTALISGRSYQWWVRALSDNGNQSPWSAGVAFTLLHLGTPTLIGPNGTINDTTPTFSWNAVTGADYYDLWVNDLTTGQAQIVRKKNVAATTYTDTAPLTAGHRYQWWVRSFSNNGNFSLWSASLIFQL